MSTGNEEAEQEPRGKRRGRHARARRTPRRQVDRRRRWPIVVVAVLALAAFLAPPPHPDVVAASQQEQADESRSAQLANALKLLSTGAPLHAVTLTASPAHSPVPQPADSAAISGLAANGIPNVALNAYRVAAARMDNTSSCGIDWSLLAGIGRVESNHGRFGGAVLDADGTSTPRIIGPALDGVKFAYIRDTDHGLWDGDTVQDRAVGPMQFIPATWRAYAIDADGTDAPDPFNINDAALAAAHYLCVAGGNLTTLDGQRRAVLAYNHSDSYVAEVLALARAYASGIPVADLPVSGNTTGPVPSPSPTYGYAPAAPGPAIGASDSTPATPGQTVGAQPSGTAQPASPPPSQPASGGTSSASGGTSSGGSGSTGGTTGGTGGTGTAGSGGGGTSSGGTSSGTSGGSTLLPLPPPPVISPPPVTSPVPSPAPPPVTDPVTDPVTTLIAGVTCNLAGYGLPLPGLPDCPPGTSPPS